MCLNHDKSVTGVDAMRLFLAALFIAFSCSQVRAAPPDSIKPGVTLAAAKATLSKHGFEMDAKKYGLAMVADDQRNELEFCPLDRNLTLIIEYRASTNLVESLAVLFISERAPKSKRNDVSLRVLEIAFEDDGVYILKLQRPTKQKNRNK
jgi:hypothetical protein